MLVSIVTALVTSLLACHLLSSGRLASLAVDHPNDRSLHHRAVPRSGGLAILIAVTFALSIGLGWPPVLWCVALFLGAVSFVDDRRGLPIVVRLAAQFAAAAVATAMQPDSSGVWIVFSLLYSVWMTNLFNFMDGADGLAGGMGAIGFSAYAVGSSLGSEPELSMLCACVASAAGGFLGYNFSPARIFMGDAGSTVLGFVAATAGLRGHAAQVWPLWFPVLVFLPFIGDASVTLLHRALRRERVWQAHREHYYQRLIRSGWDHRRTAKAAYVVMIGTAGSALLALKYAPQSGWVVLGSWLVVLGVLMRVIDTRWSNYGPRPS